MDITSQTMQIIDGKIAETRNFLIWITWAVGVNAAVLLATALYGRSSAPSDLSVIVTSGQLAFLGLSLPIVTINCLKYAELLFQKYDRR